MRSYGFSYGSNYGACSKGFTLTEILVVIGIISVLLVFAVPALLTGKKDSRDAATDGTMWTINVGLARAYKDKDPQILPGGVLSPSPSTSSGYTDVTENAVAYLVEKGYVR
jgi:prepilin-type N-terminal cleavage/methylation domain-containing protein